MSGIEHVFNDGEWEVFENYHRDVGAWGGYPPVSLLCKGLVIVAYSENDEPRLRTYTVESVRRAFEQANALLEQERASAGGEEVDLDLLGALIETGIEEYEE